MPKLSRLSSLILWLIFLMEIFEYLADLGVGD